MLILLCSDRRWCKKYTQSNRFELQMLNGWIILFFVVASVATRGEWSEWFFILNWSSWCRIFYFEVTIWGSNWLMRGWWRQTSENHDVIILNHLIDTTKLTNERGHSFIEISFMHDEQFNLLWKFSSKRVSLDKWIHAVCIFQIYFFSVESHVSWGEQNSIKNFMR